MKKSLFIISSLCVSLFACAENPPKSVTDTFNQKFQNASKVKWDQEEANEWEAEFKMGDKEMSASFDNSGNWMSTEAKLGKNEVPATVMNAVKEKYNGWKIELVESIEEPDFKGYELGIEKGKEELEVLIAADGTIKSVKTETEEDDED